MSARERVLKYVLDFGSFIGTSRIRIGTNRRGSYLRSTVKNQFNMRRSVLILGLALVLCACAQGKTQAQVEAEERAQQEKAEKAYHAEEEAREAAEEKQEKVSAALPCLCS